MCRGRCRGRCKNTVGLHVRCFKKRFLNLNFFLREMQSDCVFTTSPTPSPTHPLSVPYTSPTSPTNVPRFQAFHLKEMQWCRQGNHAIDKFMANVAATIGEQQLGMMLGSSTGAPPIPNPSVMADLARAGEWRQQGLLSEAELQAAKHAGKTSACMFHPPSHSFGRTSEDSSASSSHPNPSRAKKTSPPLPPRWTPAPPNNAKLAAS